MLLFPSPSLLAHPWWFCASQHLPQKERQGTLSASPIGHLIFGTRTSSGSITHLSCLLHLLCCHLAVVCFFFFFARMFFCTSFVQLCHRFLFESLELHVIYIPVLSRVIKHLYVVTSYAISGIAVLQKICNLAIAPPF